MNGAVKCRNMFLHILRGVSIDLEVCFGLNQTEL